MRMLQSAVDKYPKSSVLRLCLGEVQSQAGNVVDAMHSFKVAHDLQPMDPLALINASRTYQQLGQLSTAVAHLTLASNLDRALALPKVDLAQGLLQAGQTNEALAMLEEALQQARHVSEIADVLTARTVALVQLQLEQRGVCPTMTTRLAE